MRVTRMLPLWLFAAVLIVASVTASTLKKCCPAGKSLHPDLKSCVPSQNAASQFQNRTLVYANTTTGGQFNIQCPFEESDALVWDSADMNFTVNVDTFELVPDRLNGVDKFKVNEFCLDQVKSDKTYWIAFTCPCIRGVCVRTCCPRGKMLNREGPEKKYQCVNATGHWRDWSPLNFTEPRASGYFLLEELPKCTHGTFSIHMEAFNISATGVTTYSYIEDNGVLEVNHHELDSNNCLGIEGTHDNSTDDLQIKKVIFECVPPEEQPDHLRAAIYTILFVIGAIFLLATIVVHLALPVLTKGVRGKGLVAHCAFMFVAHIALVVVQLKGSTLSDGPCHTLAYLIQYTLLAGFFWLNVLCINISMTFRSLQSMVPRGMLSERKQFAWYTVYALAIPFAIFIATLATNLVYSHYEQIKEKFDFFLPNPGIGDKSCWFGKESSSILVFFYGPIGILLLINLVLFIFTTYKIYKLSHAANMINQNDNSQRHNSEHKRFLLFLKLFGLMGIPWVFEIISWAVGGNDVYWYFPDAVNILRSIFIFTTFCWKKKVWRLLCEKYPKIKKFALMICSEPNAAESSRSNPSNNESYAETVNAVSMETVALDVPKGYRNSEPTTII